MSAHPLLVIWLCGAVGSFPVTFEYFGVLGRIANGVFRPTPRWIDAILAGLVSPIWPTAWLGMFLRSIFQKPAPKEF